MALIGMRRLLLLVLLFGCRPAFAAQQEIGLTLGGLFPQDRGTIPNTVRLSGGTALQANYGHLLISGRAALGYRYDLCHAWDSSEVCSDEIFFPLRRCRRRVRRLRVDAGLPEPTSRCGFARK